jgi:tetratricopeptide (TPR) repeat protein
MNKPLFGGRRRGFPIRLTLLTIFLAVGFVVLAMNQRDTIQIRALEVFGMAPTPTAFASDLATRGSALFQNGDIAGALRLFEEALVQRPDDVNYLYEYGQLLIENEQDGEVLPFAERIIALAPLDPRGYALKGRALMWTDPSGAIQASIQGIDIDPNFAPLYSVQGVAFTNLGRWQEGLRNAQRAYELDPQDIFVLTSYQWPLTYVGRYQQAIDYLEDAIAINPNLVNPYFYLAAWYNLRSVNQPEMAIGTYNRILELQPNNAKAYLRLCQTYANVDGARFDIAQPYCDAAIRLDPTYAEAYMQRGQMQYARRNYEGSIESFNACIANGSTRIECWYIRGFAHYYLGNCEESWTILEESRLLAVNQNKPSVMEQIDNIMDAITIRCPGYSGRSVPTPAPPTPLPPTPIGGFG